MAKPNYSYEKRQRELAKQQKKQEKLKRKAASDEPAGHDQAQPSPEQGKDAS